MPYEIKGKKGKKFSVVNKDSGKVMSKGTTKPKAEKQIKSIYANMKPEHRIRHRIGLIDGMGIKNPVHRGIIKEVKKILKKEEIHGNGFWEWFNFLDPKEHPILSLVLGGTKPEMVVQAVKDYGGYAVEALLDPYSFPLAVAEAVTKTPTPPSYPTYQKPTEYEADSNVYDAISNKIKKENLVPEDPYEYDDEDIMEEDEEDYPEDNIEEYQEDIPIEEAPVAPVKKNMYPSQQISGLPIAESLDKLVEKVVDENLPKTLDEAVRFPMIYNYDETNKPLHLQAWLEMNGVAGHRFSVEEFGNTYKNQQPYAFLNFPINGGRLGKINYSKLGYSKY